MLPDPLKAATTTSGKPAGGGHSQVSNSDCHAWAAQQEPPKSLTPDLSCPQTTLAFSLFRPNPMCLKGTGPTPIAQKPHSEKLGLN